ncbi:MAG: S-layer homology domain-containing protein [Ruminococcaceae bacterium]|nr:S-layer homology domain-containing protein [Oscillospiraceae bacterium]
MKTRILSMILALLLTVTFIVPVSAAMQYEDLYKTMHTGTETFRDLASDVKTGDWYYLPVRHCINNDLIAFTGRNEFRPNEPVTRAVFVNAIFATDARLGYKKPVGREISFLDTEDNPYKPAIEWGAREGIINGYGDIFGVDDPLTREQAAMIFHRYLKYRGYSVSVPASYKLTYKDTAKISKEAAEAVRFASHSGLMGGRDGNIFDPQGKLSRAEICVMLLRMWANYIHPSLPDTDGLDVQNRFSLSAIEAVWAGDQTLMNDYEVDYTRKKTMKRITTFNMETAEYYGISGSGKDNTHFEYLISDDAAGIFTVAINYWGDDATDNGANEFIGKLFDALSLSDLEKHVLSLGINDEKTTVLTNSPYRQLKVTRTYAEDRLLIPTYTCTLTWSAGEARPTSTTYQFPEYDAELLKLMPVFEDSFVYDVESNLSAVPLVMLLGAKRGFIRTFDITKRGDLNILRTDIRTYEGDDTGYYWEHTFRVEYTDGADSINLQVNAYTPACTNGEDALTKAVEIYNALTNASIQRKKLTTISEEFQDDVLKKGVYGYHYTDSTGNAAYAFFQTIKHEKGYYYTRILLR